MILADSFGKQDLNIGKGKAWGRGRGTEWAGLFELFDQIDRCCSSEA